MNAVTLLNVSIILVSGFIAGCVCKRFKISTLIGYLLVGALIGPGGLDLTGARFVKAQKASDAAIERMESQAKDGEKKAAALPVIHEDPALEEERDAADVKNEELTSANEEVKVVATTPEAQGVDVKAEKTQHDFEKYVNEAAQSEETVNVITEIGCLLLLFGIGIEFTFDKLAATAKYMFVGGTLQMGLTIGMTILVCMVFKMGWVAGLAIGSVVALSSTALVYRSVTDVGQADTKRAQATLGLLIFQDVALVPLLLILPRILGAETSSSASQWVANPWVDMTLKSLTFCGVVIAWKLFNMRCVIERLARFQSNDVVVLYAVIVLAGMCIAALALGLTPALGALAAGLALGENRLTHQIDALVLPFRECFSAMFFISLGMLTDFAYVFHHPVVCLITLLVALAYKSLCATLALKACGMDFKGALAYGVSISQVGELAFMLLALAYQAHAFSESAYNTMLFVSVASLVLTPTLVKTALTKFGMPPEDEPQTGAADAVSPEVRRAISEAAGHVVIVGAGHIGKRVADEILALGGSVSIIDFNPVNLQPFKQNGIPTFAGDGADQELLRAAGLDKSAALFVTVPRDDIALTVVKAARDMHPTMPIVGRARYTLNISLLKRAGATTVLCEEERIADELVDLLERYANSTGDRKTALS